MHDDERFELRPVAIVRSSLTDLAAAPKQAHEGAPPAWLVFDPAVAGGLDGLCAGDRVVVLTWLHRADRDVLEVHPRGDVANPLQGVFSTRSPARPNPIGLHEVEILEIDGARVSCSSTQVDITPSSVRSWAGRAACEARQLFPPVWCLAERIVLIVFGW